MPTGYGAKGLDGRADAGRLQKAAFTASEEDGWPGRIASRFAKKAVLLGKPRGRKNG